MSVIVGGFIKAVDVFHPRVLYYVFECETCHKKFSKQASQYRKQLKISKRACSFCSRSCKSKFISTYTFQKGDKHPKWKGGRTHKNGYKVVHRSISSDHKEYMYEHRLVVERSLDRKLDPSEIVHHVDGNRKNNSIDNLIVMNRTDHAKLHKRSFNK